MQTSTCVCPSPHRPRLNTAAADAAETAERLGDSDAAKRWRERLMGLVSNADRQRPEIEKAVRSGSVERVISCLPDERITAPGSWAQ